MGEVALDDRSYLCRVGALALSGKETRRAGRYATLGGSEWMNE